VICAPVFGRLPSAILEIAYSCTRQLESFGDAPCARLKAASTSLEAGFREPLSPTGQRCCVERARRTKGGVAVRKDGPHFLGEAEELAVFFRGQRNLKDISSAAEP
jgi:hypothetical protein